MGTGYTENNDLPVKCSSFIQSAVPPAGDVKKKYESSRRIQSNSYRNDSVDCEGSDSRHIPPVKTPYHL
ncbi:MAG: hypothetical protein LBR52_00755 [Prevotellaceae bacterium]|nr:hypothetical protein [Prevotellaceae bacterium]